MILEILSGLDQVPEADIVDIGTEEVHPNEKVVGIVGLRARRLFFVLTQQADLIGAMTREINPSTETMGNLTTKVKEIKAYSERAQLLKDVFWQDIREEFGLDDQDVTIRKGWKLVANKPRSAIGELLSRLTENVPPCDNPDCPIHGRLHLQPEPFVQPPGQA